MSEEVVMVLKPNCRLMTNSDQFVALKDIKKVKIISAIPASAYQ